MIEVALALVRRNGCLLVTRRVQGVHLAGFWEFPGGKLMDGETPEACAEREALEEVGVACRAAWRRPVIEFWYPERAVRIYPVECEYLGGGPRPLQVAEWLWVPHADLLRYEFPPANRRLLEELMADS